HNAVASCKVSGVKACGEPAVDQRQPLALGSTTGASRSFPLSHPHRVQHTRRDVDPEDAHLVLYGTCLLGRYGCMGLRKHSSSTKPIRPGSGPWHDDPLLLPAWVSQEMVGLPYHCRKILRHMQE